MKIDLQQQQLNGTLPILYVYLARAGKNIKDVTYGSLDSSGVFRESAPGRGGTPGVRITYTENQLGQQPDALLFHNRYFRRRHRVQSRVS